MDIIIQWKKQTCIDVVVSKNDNARPKGVGFAKNRAVEQSRGEFLCFLDADDIMHPTRIAKQIEQFILYEDKNVIIGTQFIRDPPDSTLRYSKWANDLSLEDLDKQIYTSNGPTIIMPTWFMHRNVFKNVDGFDERLNYPEDLIFFYKHLSMNGSLDRINEELLVYRYHESQTTFSIEETIIWDIRLQELKNNVLIKLESFTIWNAGKEGRRFFRSLDQLNQDKVIAFCDVDAKKISKGCYVYEESKERFKPRIPIIHFTEAQKPFIICVKLSLTGGQFEANLNSLQLHEGIDYFHFG